jgi:hypothetical protein
MAKLPTKVLTVAVGWLALGACSSPTVMTAGGSGSTSGGKGKGGGNGSGSGGESGGDPGPGTGGFVLDIPDALPNSEAGPKQCVKQELVPARVQPELLLALDRSSSMNESLTPDGLNGVPPTRWTETLAGLEQVLMATEGMIPWGMRMFPEPGGCNVAPMVDTPIAVKQAGTIMQTARMKGYNRTGDTGTPTNVVMQAAVTDLKALGTGVPRYIVLATDGEPTCPKMPLATEAEAKAAQLAAAVQAVKDAVTAGYKTFVLGIAIDPALKAALDQLAVAGGFPRTTGDTKYYPVNSKEDVVKALNDITTNYIASCGFNLQMAAPDPKLVTVSNGNEVIPPDATNGWTFTDPARMHLELKGTACETFKKSPNPSLKVTFACIFE